MSIFQKNQSQKPKGKVRDLNEDQVREIRNRFERDPDTQLTDIAHSYGVTKSTILKHVGLVFYREPV